MPKSKSREKKPPKRVLADLEHAKTTVLNSLTSDSGQRTYDHAIREFVTWYCSEPRLAFNRTVVLRYRIHIEQRGHAPAIVSLRLGQDDSIPTRVTVASTLSWETTRSSPAWWACARRGGLRILGPMSREEYLLANQPSELERLQLQSRVWEPTGRQLLSRLGDGAGGRVLDVGCGALGWLRILSEWVGPSGEVVGTDISENLLDVARSFLKAEGVSNVELVVDDLFQSKLEAGSFDLVHARYEIAPLGRGHEQVASHRRLIKPGGLLALEEWDLGSWHFNPPALAAERLIWFIAKIFASLGGEAGRTLPELLHDIGIEEPELDAHVIALKPGHPYLRLPLQFSVALESRLLELLDEAELAMLRREAEAELAEPGRWGTTFTLIQCWGRLEG